MVSLYGHEGLGFGGFRVSRVQALRDLGCLIILQLQEDNKGIMLLMAAEGVFRNTVWDLGRRASQKLLCVSFLGVAIDLHNTTQK